MARTRNRPVLTKLELEVMKIVWDHHPEAVTVRDVVERMNTVHKKALAYNTVQTMLNILKDKGIVRARVGAGRAHDYSVRITQEDVTTSMVGDLVARLFDGEISPLLLNLVGDDSLSRSDLEKIRKVIDERLSDERNAS